MPRTAIAQLRINMNLRKQLFILRERTLSSTRTGSQFLRVVLADRTGTIQGVYFDVPAYVIDSLVVGKGVEVSGRVQEFRDQLQIGIERIEPAELGDLEPFLPVARRPLEEMRRELDDLRASVDHPDLSRLLAAIFGDETTYDAFVHAPAAKFNHHACIGGLLEHTLSVARLVLTGCDLYPDLNRELATTVALLHDLGKIRSYDPITFDFTEEGSLWTHLYVGASQVEHTIDGLTGFDQELRLRVVHAILAHHGKLEYGSPTVPMTLEAIVLHAADCFDGDARGAIDHLERGEEADGAFTSRSTMHETRLYRGGEDQNPTQQGLW